MTTTAGTVRSGDVDIHYAVTGVGTKTPIVILPPANYFSTADYQPVADLLAVDRSVVVIDPRGLAGSSWSPSKDYSHEANTSDPIAVLDALGFAKAVFVGIARGGAHSILAAAHFPDRVVAVVLADYVPAIGIGHPGVRILMKQVSGIPTKVFSTIEEASAETARTGDSASLARFQSLVKTVDGGITLTRDPDFINPIPFAPSNWLFRVPIDVDIFAELSKVTVPVLNIRVNKAPAPYPAETVARLASEFPTIKVVEGIPSGQDIASEAPSEFAMAIRTFLDECVV